MTKHRDVNKCRRQEKLYKMAALIRQANKRHEMANKPKIKKERKKERMVKKKGKRERKQHFLKRKRRQVMSASNGTKARYT